MVGAASWVSPMIANGPRHTLVLKSDGMVWAWGNNTSGELGDGTSASRSRPVMVKGLNDVTAVSAGFFYSLTLKRDGTVWAWGHNPSGWLGDGTTSDRRTPVQLWGQGTTRSWRLFDLQVVLSPSLAKNQFGDVLVVDLVGVLWRYPSSKTGAIGKKNKSVHNGLG